MSPEGPAERAARRPSRRAVLRGGTGAAVAAAAAGLTGIVPVLGSCTRSDRGPDELEAPWAAARADAALAGATARTHGGLAARLGAVVSDRSAHADALDREIRRARPDRGDALDSVTPPGPPTVPPSADAALVAVRDALGRARDDGRALALGVASYRCGLVTSVTACCAGHVTELG